MLRRPFPVLPSRATRGFAVAHAQRGYDDTCDAPSASCSTPRVQRRPFRAGAGAAAAGRFLAGRPCPAATAAVPADLYLAVPTCPGRSSYGIVASNTSAAMTGCAISRLCMRASVPTWCLDRSARHCSSVLISNAWPRVTVPQSSPLLPTCRFIGVRASGRISKSFLPATIKFHHFFSKTRIGPSCYGAYARTVGQRAMARAPRRVALWGKKDAEAMVAARRVDKAPANIHNSSRNGYGTHRDRASVRRARTDSNAGVLPAGNPDNGPGPQGPHQLYWLSFLSETSNSTP